MLENIAQIGILITNLAAFSCICQMIVYMVYSHDHSDAKQKYTELSRVIKVDGNTIHEFNGQTIEITGQCVSLDKPLFVPGTHTPVVMYTVETFKNYVFVENAKRIQHYDSSKEYKTSWGLRNQNVTIDVTDIPATNVIRSEISESQNCSGSGEILNDYSGKKVLLGQTEKYSGIEEGCILTVIGKLHILSNNTYKLIQPGYFTSESVSNTINRLEVLKNGLQASIDSCVQNIKISGFIVLCYLFVYIVS